MRIILAAVGIALSGIGAMGAPRDGIPQLDFESTCRATPPVAMDREQTLKSCINDEKQAKADLPAQWRRSQGQWRESCLRQTTLGGLSSYVELITCLEMHDPNPPSLNRAGMTQPATKPPVSPAPAATPPAATPGNTRP